MLLVAAMLCFRKEMVNLDDSALCSFPLPKPSKSMGGVRGDMVNEKPLCLKFIICLNFQKKSIVTLLFSLTFLQTLKSPVTL